jgi:hypothetical protein
MVTDAPTAHGKGLLLQNRKNTSDSVRTKNIRLYIGRMKQSLNC